MEKYATIWQYGHYKKIRKILAKILLWTHLVQLELMAICAIGYTHLREYCLLYFRTSSSAMDDSTAGK